MKSWKQIRERRRRRRLRVRGSVRGTTDRPRLSVHRSNMYVYAQIIDDQSGATLAASSSLMLLKQGRVAAGKTANRQAAKEVGLDLAARAKEKGIGAVRFDRGPYRYHGRVMALAEGAREGGLVF